MAPTITPKSRVTNEIVTVKANGRIVEARVVLDSLNGRALLLEMDAMIYGFAGILALIWNGTTYEDFNGHIIDVSDRTTKDD